jgi:hypothetical protein
LDIGSRPESKKAVTRHRTPHGGRFAPLQAPFHRSKMSTPVVDKTGKNLLAGGGGCAYL